MKSSNIQQVDARWVFSAGKQDLDESWHPAKTLEENEPSQSNQTEDSETSPESPITPLRNDSKVITEEECFARFKEITESEFKYDSTEYTTGNTVIKSPAIERAKNSINRARKGKSIRSSQKESIRNSVLASLDDIIDDAPLDC